MSDWQAYEAGNTLGLTGVQGGTIMRDDAHEDGARITLERGCLRAPYAIISSLYGMGDHTRFIADEPTANHAFDQMRAALTDILMRMPAEDADDYDAKFAAAEDAFAAFGERYA